MVRTSIFKTKWKYGSLFYKYELRRRKSMINKFNSFFIVFTAPTIVNAAPGPVVVSFGSFGGYTYNPWSTLPYLQLPGWTVTTVYAIVGGLFVLYIFALLGSYIPGVSDFVDTISGE